MRSYARDWSLLRESIIEDYRSGESLRKISEKIGVSHATINKRLSLWGEHRRGTDAMRRGGRTRKKYRGKDCSGLRLGQLLVLGKDPILYPMRYLVRCDCGKLVQLSEKQLLKKRTCGHDKR